MTPCKCVSIPVRDVGRFYVGQMHDLARAPSGHAFIVRVVDIDGNTVTFEMPVVGEA